MSPHEHQPVKSPVATATAMGTNPAACPHQWNTDTANDPFFRAAVNAAKTRTYQAAKSARLTPAERDDLCQDILLDIFERAGQFDPTRGGPGTFTGLVSKHRTAEFLNARKADRQRLTFAEPDDVDTLAVVAIDRAMHGIDLTQGPANDEGGTPDQLDHSSNESLCWGGDIDMFSDSWTRHDLQAAVAYMNDEQTDLFDLLSAHQDLPDAAKASGMASATFYRRVADLQMHLRMFGFRAAA